MSQKTQIQNTTEKLHQQMTEQQLTETTRRLSMQKTNYNPITAQELNEIITQLFSHFKPNPDDDERFFNEIITEFSATLDVKDQLKQFHAWCLDQHPTKILNCRFRFRSWLKNAANYKMAKTIYPPSAYPISK